MSDEPRPIPEACRRLGGIHRSTLYREVRDGRLWLTKIRGGSFVMDSEIERYLRIRGRKPGKAA